MSHEDMDADELLLSASRSGAPAAQWPNVGYVLEGYVTARPRKTEQRDADDKIKTFDDGTTRWQVLIEIQTALRNPEFEDDEGLRTIWGKWEIQKAISAALLEAGVKRLEIGGFLQVGRIEDVPPAKKTYKPTQKFVAKYTPPAQQAADDMFNAPPAPPSTGLVTGAVVFENQHQEVTAAPKRITTLDALKGMSFSAQGTPQATEAPF